VGDEVNGVIPLRGRMTRDDRSARVGMIAFICGWTMMFAALLTAYVLLRTSQASGYTWPPAGVPRIPRELPSVATLVLVVSSFTMNAALAGIRGASRAALVRWLGVTVLLAIAFLVMQTITWVHLSALGLAPGKSLYAASFFGLTIFHALHVVVGIGGLLSLLPRAQRGAFSAHDHVAVRSWALYWHFVDVAWIAFFAAVVLW
jgi:heme/copper-type cytochrome/quinol oxidase subunit 3